MTSETTAQNDPQLSLVDDSEAVQAAVLAAAINGNMQVRSGLPALVSAFDEPYRTVAAKLTAELAEGRFVDRHTLGVVLQSCHLARRTAAGVMEPLTAMQVLDLIVATGAQPGQAESYLDVLRSWQRDKQAVELTDRAVELAKAFGNDPDKIAAEIKQLAADARNEGVGGGSDSPSELLELIPFMHRLVTKQTGSKYLGLNSGFQHVNNLLNGLDTGLGVLAAPPGAGKTTFCIQLASQAAELNKMPVIFVSMEQSKDELRAKTLARLSRLQYRHILRGRLNADDPQDSQRLFEAANKYAQLGRFLTIVEGGEKTNVDTICGLAQRQMVKAGATRCLVIVDYLQIMPVAVDAAKGMTSVKDRIDFQVSALRRMARQLDSPVWVISAENRAGYKSKTLDVFKESGGIEYSADIGMVFSRAKENDAGAEYRLLDLNVIKHRNGERGVIKFKFYAKRAEFVETGKEDFVEQSDE